MFFSSFLLNGKPNQVILGGVIPSLPSLSAIIMSLSRQSNPLNLFEIEKKFHNEAFFY